MALKLEHVDGLFLSRKATIAIASAYRLVKEDADPANVILCTANADPLGVLDTKAAASEDVRVAVTGVRILEAGAAVAVGDLVVSDATGRGVPKGAVADTHYKVVGRALTVAGAAGELFSVLIDRQDFYVKA